MESHSYVLESNLKQMAELGSMERERLEARANSAEAYVICVSLNSLSSFYNRSAFKAI